MLDATTPIQGHDHTGNRFGKYTAIQFIERRGRHYYWLCRCDCGRERRMRTDSLLGGQQCVCVSSHAKGVKNRTHGMYKTGEYRCWQHMLARCRNKKNKSYARYGGRGIVVCPEWVNSFEAFFLHMGPRPSPRHSIDRFPDQNGNYEPSNCRWATPKEQQNNMRSNWMISYQDKTLSVTEWSRILGMKIGTLRRRLGSGWSVEEAFLKPISIHKKGQV